MIFDINNDFDLIMFYIETLLRQDNKYNETNINFFKKYFKKKLKKDCYKAYKDMKPYFLKQQIEYEYYCNSYLLKKSIDN